MPFVIVKINNKKPHLKWSGEARRENSHASVTQHTLLAPSGRDTTLLLHQKEEDSSLPSNSSANETLV